jgi:hypothetical protein
MDEPTPKKGLIQHITSTTAVRSFPSTFAIDPSLD